MSALAVDAAGAVLIERNSAADAGDVFVTGFEGYCHISRGENAAELARDFLDRTPNTEARGFVLEGVYDRAAMLEGWRGMLDQHRLSETLFEVRLSDLLRSVDRIQSVVWREVERRPPR